MSDTEGSILIPPGIKQLASFLRRDVEHRPQMRDLDKAADLLDTLAGLVEVEGYVWCSKHDEIHDDTLNPMGYIEDGKQDYCLPEQHRKLYMTGAP